MIERRMREGNKIITIDKSILEGKLSNQSKRYLEYCLVFMSDILDKQVLLSKEDQKDKFITFSFERRKQLIPKYQVSLIESDLIRLRLIEKDNSYSKESQKAQGFRLTDEFFTNETFLYSIEDKLVNKRLTVYTQLNMPSKSIDLSSPTNQDLVYQSSKFKLEIPEYCVTNTLDYNTEGINVDSNNHYVYQFSEESASKESHTYRLLTLGKVLNQKEFYSRKDNNDRFYSKWQSIPKKFRKYISFSDNPLGLIQIDISCSQPAILGGLVSKKHKRRPKDLTKYIEYVTTGKLYDVFDNYSREQAKVGIMLLLFGSEIYGQYQALEDRFKDEFPSVYDYLTDLKKEDYHKSSELLRKTEAKLMIDNVCSTLMKIKSKDFAYMPMHDAIIVPENYFKLVAELIKSEFKSMFGFECHVKTDRVTESKVKLSDNLLVPDHFKNDGYEFQLLCSNGELCIFSQEREGKIVGYEVHKNVFKKNVLPKGQIIEKWFRPSTSQWGRLGFTTYTVKGAIDRFSKMIKK